MSDTKSEGEKMTAYEILRLAGRCANGAERDGGRIYHAVPRMRSTAMCGATFGSRSAGWSSQVGREVTCGRCVKKVAALSPVTDTKGREEQ